jgi:hypothetical protein
MTQGKKECLIMAEQHASSQAPDTTPIYRLLRKVKHLLRLSWVATGLGITLGLWLTTLVAFGLLDLALPLWPAFRLLGLMLIIVPASWAFLMGVIVPLCRRLAAAQVARRVEATLPKMHNRLVSCVDLTSRKKHQPSPLFSQAFFQRLVRETLERIRGFRARKVIDFLSLRRSGLFAGAGMVALLAAWLLFSDRLPTAFARLFSPFADIPPASGVLYNVTPGDAKVLRGEDVVFEAQIVKGDPEKLRLEMRGEAGPALWHDLQKDEAGRWKLTLNTSHIAPGFEHGFRYRVHGGGTWSKEHRIAILGRPSLVSLQTTLHYPDYMGLRPLAGPPQIADATGPEGGTVEVAVQADGDVATGQILWSDARGRQAFPMQPSGEDTWVGRVPLERHGTYRVELKNELGYANPTMKTGKITVLPDNPPQVNLERPGNDLVVSKPVKVPLVVFASDDWGLADVSISVQEPGRNGFLRRPLKRYDPPERSDLVVSSLDLAKFQLKPGDQVRYRVEASDRKGQAAETREFVIRFDPNQHGADKQKADLERAEEVFEEKLVKLIAEQKQVQETLHKLNDQFKPELEKAQQAEQVRHAQPRQQPIDPQIARQLEPLRRELGKLAEKERQNTQLGEQISGEMKNTAEQSEKNALVPHEISNEMKKIQEEFQQAAVQPLKNLTQEMEKARGNRQEVPDAKQMQQTSDRVQKELEAIRDRLKALAEAEKKVGDDAQKALEDLRQEAMRQEAGQAENDLSELRDFIGALRDQLKGLEGQERQLMSDTKNTPEDRLPERNQDQSALEKKAEKPLADTRNLQKPERLPRKRRSAKESDALANEEEKANAAEAGEQQQGENGEDLPYKPLLGGKPQSNDSNSNEEAGKNEPGEMSAERAKLGQRQSKELNELDAAEKSLGSDEEALAGMLGKLRQASRPHQGSEKGQPGKPSDQELSQLMQSEMMQKALEMASRMHGGKHQQPAHANASQPARTHSPVGNLTGITRLSAAEADLNKLDPDLRAMILKLQPMMREELLQGMQEQGPEGYRKFIENYFHRLSKSQPGR